MKPERKHVLFSIKPMYAKLIILGSKTIELRTRIPSLQKGDVVVFYESLPVQKVTCYAEVKKVEAERPTKLWDDHHGDMALSKEVYDDYFMNRSIAYGIVLKNVTKILPTPLHEISPEIVAPQSYRYLSREEFKIVESARGSL